MYQFWLLFQDFQIQLLYNCTQISANQTKCEVKSRKNEVEELKIGHLCSVTVDVARIFTTQNKDGKDGYLAPMLVVWIFAKDSLVVSLQFLNVFFPWLVSRWLKWDPWSLYFIQKDAAEKGAPATSKPGQEVGKEREVTRKEGDTLQQQDAWGRPASVRLVCLYWADPSQPCGYAEWCTLL